MYLYIIIFQPQKLIFNFFFKDAVNISSSKYFFLLDNPSVYGISIGRKPYEFMEKKSELYENLDL